MHQACRHSFSCNVLANMKACVQYQARQLLPEHHQCWPARLHFIIAQCRGTRDKVHTRCSTRRQSAIKKPMLRMINSETQAYIHQKDCASRQCSCEARSCRWITYLEGFTATMHRITELIQGLSGTLMLTAVRHARPDLTFNSREIINFCQDSAYLISDGMEDVLARASLPLCFG